MAQISNSVIPITGSTIAWEAFLKDTATMLGSSPVKSIDAAGLALGDYAKYLVALGELQSRDVRNPVDVLREAGSILQHIHFSFIITGTSGLIFRISESTNLNIVSRHMRKGRFALVSGTLREWKNSIMELSKCKSPEVLWVIEALLGSFYDFGLKHVFNEIKRLK